MNSMNRGPQLPVVQEQEDESKRPCSRRDVMRGLATALAAAPLVAACGPSHTLVVGSDAGSPPPTPDAGSPPPPTPDAGSPPGHDAGSTSTPDAGSVCDNTVNLCIDLSDSTNASVLGPVGGSGTVNAHGDTIIIVHTDASTYKALSAICTHAGCPVSYQRSQSDLYCACHGSAFGMDGHVIRGPAFSPLRVYRTQLDGTMLTVFLA